MKTKKKALLTLMCAALLVVGSVMGTMAYLTAATKAVNNTFTVGKVEITLDEAKVDEYGEEVSGADRVDKNTYKLIPGHEYTKDPTVHVSAGSEDCWLFVKVENGIAAIEDSNNTIADQMEANDWSLVDETNNIYAYKDAVKAETDVPVFSTFKVTGDAAVDNYEDASINVTAYAVQKDGFDTAAEAWKEAGLT